MADKIVMGGVYIDSDKNDWRILCLDAPGPKPVVAVNQHGSVGSFTAEGRFRNDGVPSHGDLIEYKPRVQCEVWVWRTPSGSLFVHEREIKGGSVRDDVLVARITIDVEEGEGLGGAA